jgi:CheY-like chemotaxis protein
MTDQKIRIIVIDDQAVARAAIREQLQAWGVVVDEAAAGPPALEQLSKAAASGALPDAVLLDVQMPSCSRARSRSTRDWPASRS